MGLFGLIFGGIADARKASKQRQAMKDDGVTTVKVKDLYSIDVPKFLTPTTKLSKDASLQYWNKTLDISFQVIDESKQELTDTLNMIPFSKDKTLLDKMAAISLSTIYGDISKVDVYDYNEVEINGLPAVTVNVFKKRTFFDDAVYASFAFIEGKNHLYQINIMTGGSSIKKLSEKMETVIKSFKEL